MKYQLFKNGVPVAIAYDADECDRLYMKYDCDEVRGIKTKEDDDESSIS